MREATRLFRWRKQARQFIEIFVLFILYFFTAKFGLNLGAVSGFAAPVWPPSGIALAALLIFGWRIWPGITLGAFVVNATLGASYPETFGIAFGNTLEAVMGGFFLHKIGFHNSLDRLKDVFGFILLAAILSTFVGATLGTTSLFLGGEVIGTHYGKTWLTWWLGDMMGILIIGPVFLVWSTKFNGGRTEGWRVAEAIGLMMLTFAGGIVLFSDWVISGEFPLLRPVFIFPILMLVAVRLGQRGSVTAVSLVSILALVAAIGGHAKFWGGYVPSDSLLRAQVFLTVVAVSEMVLAAAIMEGKRERNALKAAKESEKFLAEATEILSSTIDYRTTLKHIAQAPVPRFGDWCIVHIIEEETQRVQDVEWFCAAPNKEEFLQQYIVRYLSDLDKSVMIGSVFNSRKSQWIIGAFESFYRLIATDEEQLYFLRALAPKAIIAVPMFLRGKVLGVISIASSRKVDQAWLKEPLLRITIIEELARRAAIALENARLYRAAQEAIQSRDEFLSIASHELKTPLTSLSLQLQMLNRVLQKSLSAFEGQGAELDQVSIPIKIAKGVMGADSQSKKMAALLEELLDLTRIRLGRLQLSRERLDLGAIVTETVDRFRAEAAQMGLRIYVRVIPMMGMWDRIRVEQVINNLISNAIKYGKGKSVSVTLERDRSSRWAVLVVRDYGIGISPEMQEKIFQRFERAGISGKKIAGLGLGLYISRQIVEAHGGRISVKSSLGKGSVFTVEIPLDFSTDEMRRRGAEGLAG